MYKVIEVISTPVAVTELSENPFVNVIYDNGEVYLAFDLKDKKDVNISVYNSIGEKILFQQEKNVVKNKIKLRLSNLSSGIYISVADLSGDKFANRIIIPSR